MCDETLLRPMATTPFLYIQMSFARYSQMAFLIWVPIQISPRALRQFWINIFFVLSQENLINLTSLSGSQSLFVRVSLLQNPVYSSTAICILLQCSFPSLGHCYKYGTTTQLLKLRNQGFWLLLNPVELCYTHNLFVCENRNIPPFFFFNCGVNFQLS